ncbi:MAG: PAS domain-containing protein [Hoeflea sp.]|uniref:PAS domain-containing protein n=1 Tax=Hoeflea sp. TaxID=1940281 RepID=UPI0032987CE4
MKHKNSLELFEYWTTRRGARAAPNRTDIEPADIRALLPHVFICDLTSDNQMSFRLAGTGLCSLCGRELKGSAFGSLWLNDGVRNASRTGVSVASRATPAVLSLDCLTTGGRVAQAEMLLLPITGPTGEHDRLIGVLSLFKPPFWVGHDPLAGFSTTGIRFIDSSREPVFLANRPEIGLSSAARVLQAQARPETRKVAHLVVLEGGRRD